MAEKQATVYIIDVGRSMGRKHHGRTETDLEYALKYVWDRITTTVLSGRKTDMIGVVGLRTDDSENELAGEVEYENISVFSPISQFLMPQVRDLEAALKPSLTSAGDGISAIVVAIQMITTHCRKLKYTKNIVMVTNGTGSFDFSDSDQIAAQIRAQDINLTVLGVDFDDAEFGVKEEDKDALKAENEGALKSLCDAVDGAYGTLEEAVQELGRPRLKKVRPMASYKGKLTLGDADQYDTAFAIDVERYPRTMVAKPMSASRYTTGEKEKEDEGGEGKARSAVLDDRGGRDLQVVRQARSYQVQDESEPGGKMDIDKEEMEKGYKYGRTVVPISSTDEEVATLDTEPSMQIVGFIPAEEYKRFYHMSTTNVIVGQKGNEKAVVALSSLIHALYEVGSFALVRFVKRKNDAPVMMVLAPEIELDFECLVDVQVPFTEDVRPFRFPSLGTIKTVTGKTLDKHRNIPTHDMEKFMSDYVDSMDLAELEKDGDGEAIEYPPIDESFSPIIHRINQVVGHRAIHPKVPLPSPYGILMKYSQPPEELAEKSRTHLEKLIKACDVKQVDTKSQSKKREQPKSISGLDLAGLLDSGSANKRVKISLRNAVPEFTQALRAFRDESDFKDAGSQMLVHVKELIGASLADINYDRACELLRTMRDRFREYGFPAIYNDLLVDLKRDIIGKKLNGDRTDAWWTIRMFGLGLVTTEEGDGGTKVTAEEAKEFWKF